MSKYREAPEKSVWRSMLARCTKPHVTGYANYGGRGIAVCQRWHSYETFVADMGRRPSVGHSIERINNDGPYSPDNCRWATRAEQSRNKRNTRLITAGGVTKPMQDWANALGIFASAIHARIAHGWSEAEAVTTPPLGREPPLPISGVRGVSFNCRKPNRPWHARKRVGSNWVSCGYWPTIPEAARALENYVR